MTRIWPVVRREYLERVRSKAFIVGTIVGPLLMAALMLVPGLVMSRQRGKPLRVAVVDASGSLQASVEEALRSRSLDGLPRFVVQAHGQGDPARARAALKAAVLAGKLDGYVYLPPDTLERSVAEYYGKNVTNFGDLRLLDQAVEEAVIGSRLAREGLGAERLKALTRKLDLKTIRVSSSGERADRGASFMLSMVLMMMLYTTVAMWGAALMNGVIEEKTNRVVEMVVSSIPTSRLFAGKLLGVGAAGLTQFLVWVLFMGLFALYGASMAAAGGADMPEVSLSVAVFFILFFLLGFFLYGGMYTAIGAAVNSQQEAQSLVFPVVLPLIGGVMCFPAVLANPDSSMSVTLSLVPFWTPLLMFLRITALTPPAWQIGLSIALTLLTIVALNSAAARIYRVGILMYGKRPTFPEIMKWVTRP